MDLVEFDPDNSPITGTRNEQEEQDKVELETVGGVPSRVSTLTKLLELFVMGVDRSRALARDSSRWFEPTRLHRAGGSGGVGGIRLNVCLSAAIVCLVMSAG